MMTYDIYTNSTSVPHNLTPSNLQQIIKQTARHYLASMGAKQLKNSEMYDLFLTEMEQALFEEVLNFTGGNESKASRILGISRGTLRQRRELFGHYSNMDGDSDD